MTDPGTASSTFRERYVAPAPWWLTAVLVAVVMGWLIWVPTQYLPLSIVVGLVTLAITLTAVWRLGSLVVSASADGVHAGHAFLDAAHIGSPQLVDSATWKQLMGPGSDHRAYLVTRPWLRSGVLFPVVDESDPTPYWLVASRRPTDLAAALGHGPNEGDRRGQAASEQD